MNLRDFKHLVMNNREPSLDFRLVLKISNHFSLDYNLSSLLCFDLCLCQIIHKNIMNLKKKMSLKNKDVYGGHDHIRLTLQECKCTYSSEKLACMKE